MVFIYIFEKRCLVSNGLHVYRLARAIGQPDWLRGMGTSGKWGHVGLERPGCEEEKENY